MILEDPDHGAVTLDKAEDGGLLGWPDIVGKYVSIGWRGMPEAQYPPEWKVLQVGPIGLLVERVVLARGDVFSNDQPGPLMNETRRMVVPWSMAIIAWVERDEPVQEPTGDDR